MDEVAERVGFDSVTTFKARADLLAAWKRGKEETKDKLRSVQLRSALVRRNIAMQIFLGKQMAFLNQRDRWDHEVAGPGGGVIPLKVTVDWVKPGKAKDDTGNG